MGLQVWLPLNGNLNNQGLSNVTATNNGATVDNNGKIGKCYSFGTGTSYITVDPTSLKTATEFSFCCWVNIISWNTDYATIFAVKNGTGVSWANLIFALLRNGSNSELCFCISNGSSATNANCKTGTLTTGTWYHITCTYISGTIKLYVNGEVVNTYSTSIVPAFSSIANLWIGRANSGSYQSNVKLNDVRIYNHALSAQEVKLLSQGLILHYPLDRNGWGQDNLAHNTYGLSPFSTSQVEFKAYDVGVLDVTNGETITVSFFLDMTVATAASSGYLQVYNTNYKGPHQIVAVNVLAGRKLVVGEDIHERISFTTTINNRSDANRSTDVLEFYSNYNTENEIFISNIKVERGTKATQWSPNPSDTLYTTMGIGNAVEYDISGYQNNGTRKNTFTYTTNSSKYKLATIFNGSNNSIAAGQGAKVKDAITISCWGYMNSWSSYNGRLLSCTEGGGWNFEPSSEKMNFAMGTGTSSNTYKSVTSTTTLAQLGSGWHMFTGTYDGFNTKIYIDGVLENTNAAYTTKTPIYYLAANGIFVGAEAAGSATDPTGSYFNGYLSDVRIYATALSDDDIKSLYESNRL